MTTDLRTAAQQALEALELVTDLTNHDDEIYDAITALRAALATGDNLSPTEPVQEPVAWMYEHDGMVHDADNPPFFTLNRWVTPVNEPYTETPLYTAQPQRKPLTEEEVYSLFRVSGSPVEFARAIERAHGIGGDE